MSKQALADAIKRIKSAGFSHIKVELEAQMDRGDDDDCDCDECRYCDDCDGRGELDCDWCGTDGVVESETGAGNTEQVECGDCLGTGYITCSYCDGGYRESGGHSGDYGSTSVCEDFILDRVSPEALRAKTYSEFYNDGSVDSEFTFTVDIDHAEVVLEYIEAFKQLGKEIGNLDVRGAGMHITILPKESNGKYPVREWAPGFRLEPNGIKNFKVQMRKMMPSLFFLASHNWRSRTFSYRYPTVSGEKYAGPMSAVALCTYGDTCLEYRVFETCYERPEAFLEYVEVIANSLQFYTDPSLKAPEMKQEFWFNDRNRSIGRLFDSPEAMRVLNKQLKYLKPKNKSLAHLKRERSVSPTIKELALKRKKKVAIIRANWAQARREAEKRKRRPLTDDQEATLRRLMIDTGWSYEKARGELLSEMPLPNVRDYIRQNLRSDGFSITV